MTEPRPTRAELEALGRSIELALRPVCQAHPELVYAVAYALPREGTDETIAAATTTNIADPQRVVILLVHSASYVVQHIHERAESS